MITIHNGDIFDFGAKDRILLHSVNCQVVMGSGVAKQVKEKYLAAYNAYCLFSGVDFFVDEFTFRYIPSYKGKNYVLSPNERLGKVHLWRNILGEPNQYGYIANAHTQLNYGYDGKRYTSYDAVLSCLEDLYQFCLYQLERGKQLTVVMPYKMASDRGGADWEAILALVRAVFKKIDVIIVKYEV